MKNLSLSNVINVTLMPPVRGLSEFNTANLFLLSYEVPVNEEFTEGYRVYKSLQEVMADFDYESMTARMASAIFGQTPNILSNGGNLIIGLPETGESQQEAFVRFSSTCLFCGWLTTNTLENDLVAWVGGNGSSSANEVLMPELIAANGNKIGFIVSNNENDLDVDGAFEYLKNIGVSRARYLYYGMPQPKAKVALAAYASKAMSTIFEGSLTTQTMHLKELTGIEPDGSMTQTILNKCKDLGADTYVSIEGVPCVFTSGANGYFDEVFNELWFCNALQVAGFNYLRKTGTKIPQTETGMDGLKNAYAQVCIRGINNGYLAPGSWTRPDTFGKPDTFKRNIETSGFYIYSAPIAQQTVADREARKAPLVQIAAKTAGAIHSTDVVIYINL